MRTGRSLNQRSTGLRLVHALLFELCTLLVCLPVISTWLQISLYKALMTDIGFALFAVIYAYGFNWAYDRLFPLPATRPEQAGR
ncbi:chlorhexidine efflux transporter [Desulfogranum mediterraneum]|uniref:chlorhexidine efflux transporter n=1 Tax=Desulfogranum mediterraneum TaxID=160661 RepID=UPI00040AEEA9|nr:chlorhexidine efflux transporter [Desulfogranum mediterraneum]